VANLPFAPTQSYQNSRVPASALQLWCARDRNLKTKAPSCWWSEIGLVTVFQIRGKEHILLKSGSWFSTQTQAKQPEVSMNPSCPCPPFSVHPVAQPHALPAPASSCKFLPTIPIGHAVWLLPCALPRLSISGMENPQMCVEVHSTWIPCPSRPPPAVLDLRWYKGVV
jgi:hypothetical protein